MNLLVGASGFVGGHVVEYLFQQGEISKGTFRMGSHLKIMDTNGVQGIEADLSDHHSLHEAMEGVDAVYNMASPMPNSDSDFMKVNTEGILNLLEVATESKVKSFIHLSTLDVYGFTKAEVDLMTPLRPAGEYQRSKAEAERLLTEFTKRNQSPKVTIIRAARALGSRDETLAVPILKMVEEGRTVVPGGGLMSYTHPKDIAQAMLKAATGNLANGSTILLKSFDATPDELVRNIGAATGKEFEAKRQGIFTNSALPKYTSEQLKASLKVGAQENWGQLGYSPQYDLKSTSAEIANWYKKEPWVVESS